VLVPFTLLEQSPSFHDLEVNDRTGVKAQLLADLDGDGYLAL
jgi:hypothetical protein